MLLYYFIIAAAICSLLFFLREKKQHHILLILFNVLQWGITVYMCFHFRLEALGYFTADASALLMLIVLSILTTTSSYHSVGYLKHHVSSMRVQSIYYSAFCILVMAQTGVFLSSHIALTWVFVELTTFAATMLIFHERTEYAIEAAWKYLFVCSIAITFAFIGILFLSISAQEAGALDLSYKSLLLHAGAFNPFWLKLAFLFILVGFSAKMGLFPMHTVCVDAHTVAPPPISAFISTTLMNVGFIAIFRTYSVVASTSIVLWANHVLLVAGTLSVFVAAIYLLKVNHFKRMSAYSSLENMGIVALGLGAGGIGYYAALLHIIFHSFTKASVFYQIQQVFHTYKSYMIRDTGSYFKYNTPGAIVILFVFICITAMPPSGMFISEFMIFRALFTSHYIWLLIPILILLTIAMWALGKNFFRLIFLPPVDFDDSNVEKIGPVESLSQFILLGLVIYLGLNPPDIFVSLLNEAVINLPH
jgi:hydrogenase-4 component F